MGQFLDKPMTQKSTEGGIGPQFKFAISCMQGWRAEMEDTHASHIGFADQEISFFAVFDGHGGATASQQSAINIVKHVSETDFFKQAVAKGSNLDPIPLGEAIKTGLLTLDQELRETMTSKDSSGTTAVTCFITQTDVIFGNCGDSRAVLCSDSKLTFATKDHKPNDEAESARIREAGGFLEFGRVCGNLAVSRSLGDFSYKDVSDLPPERQKVCSLADISILKRDGTEDFIVLACDGIWDVMTNEEVCEFVIDHLKGGVDVNEIAERLLDHCLGKNSRDNMSVCIVVFDHAPKAVAGHIPKKLASLETGIGMNA